jgi:DNA-binding LacI/PurR family transcriptional regulator
MIQNRLKSKIENRLSFVHTGAFCECASTQNPRSMQLVPQRSSLVAEAIAILRDGMRAGLWKDFLPGEMALCERLQVSRVTLRAALDQLQREGWCHAGQGRRRRINAARVKSTGRPPGTRVLLLSPLPLQNLPASAIFWVDALRDHLAAAGYKLEFLSSHAAFARQPDRGLESLLRESQPAGCVLYLSTPAQQHWFSDRALPCVVSGSCHPGVRLSSVDIDYAATCAHAAGLLAARQRTHIALLMPRSAHAGNLESERGFLEAGRKYEGLQAQVAHHDGTVSNICTVLDRLLRGSQPVDGLLLAKPTHVVTAISHLLRRGMRLPGELSVISRDDDPVLEHLVPVVSRYHTDPVAFARKISRLVVDLVRSGVQNRHESRLMPVLVRGETLG